MNGKGSKQRPRQVSQEQLGTNWNTAFQAKPACGTCRLWDGSSYHQYGDCQKPGPVKITKHRSEKCGEWEKK